VKTAWGRALCNSVGIRYIKNKPVDKPEHQQWSLMQNVICKAVNKGRDQEAAASDE
jgi:hypothetical protein